MSRLVSRSPRAVPPMATAVLLAVLAVLAVLAGCVPAPESRAVPSERATAAHPDLVWPAPPAAARIAYVGSIEKPPDLGISRGLFGTLVDALLGASEVRLEQPMAVLSVGALLYVADPGVGGVHRFDRDGGTHQLIRGEGDRPLPSPVALALGPNEAVYVSDSALAEVLLIEPGADVARGVDLESPLGRPTGIAYDPVRGDLFVVDTAAHRVNVFDAGGRRSRVIGERGSGEVEFNFPTLLWRHRAAELLVTDALNFRIQRLDFDGGFLGAFGNPGDGSGDIARHKGVATDRGGHIYVVDALFHAVQIFDRDGRFLLSFGLPGQAPGEFWLPTGIFIDTDDVIYVADSYNRRVQMFRYVGAAI